MSDAEKVGAKRNNGQIDADHHEQARAQEFFANHRQELTQPKQTDPHKELWLRAVNLARRNADSDLR